MGESSSLLLPALKAIVGDANLLTADVDVAPFVTDWRDRYHGRARAVVRPADAAEVAAVVDVAPTAAPRSSCRVETPACAAARPRAQTATKWWSRRRASTACAPSIRQRDDHRRSRHAAGSGRPPRRTPACFSRCRSLPREACAIGGNLATNAGGTAVIRYGNARDLVLASRSFSPTDASGTDWKGLRKDNTGYDLKQLFLGSEGTLGIITAAVLKLFARPRVSATAWAGVRDVSAAVALLRLMRGSLGDRLTGFELISSDCVALARERFATLPDPLPGHAWYVLVQADDAAVSRAARAGRERPLRSHLRGHRSRCDRCAIGSAGSRIVERAAAHPGSTALEGPNIKHDIGVPVSRIPAFFEQARDALDAALPGVRYVVFGHLGDGNLHYNLSRRAAAMQPASWR
jgi:FAD/FMN-containing dehydrogenase